MAARGRGRGRGGRGGRGGGSVLGPPGLRDDDGNLVQAEFNHGPPPLFPALELPHDPPSADAHDQLLLLRRSDLLKYYRASPYHIGDKLTAAKQVTAATTAAAADGAGGGAAGGAGGGLDDVERYADRFTKKVQRQRKPPLATLLTLHPHHFPEELFTDKDKRLAARGSKSADLFRRSAGGGGATDAAALRQTLDKYNQLAQRSGKEGPGGAVGGRGGGGGAGAGGEGDAEGEVDEGIDVAHDEDDDDVMEEDDYYQGEYFDDDEGYDDFGEDGNDDGPVY